MSDKARRELAMITDVRFGSDEFSGDIYLRFLTHIQETFAIQALPVHEAIELLRKHSIVDIHDLEGRCCIVKRTYDTMEFEDLFQPK